MPTIQNKLIRHQIFLERFADTLARIMLEGIDRARDTAILELVNGPSVINTASLQKSLESIISRRMEDALDEVKELSGYEAEFNERILKKELEEVASATETAILAALLNKPMPVGLADKSTNRKIESAYDKFAQQSARQLIQPIKDAQVLGGDSLEAAAAIAALAAGLLSAQSKSLSRSSVVHSANTSKEEVYKVNPISQVEWVSVLDSNTTDYCRGQDGKKYDIGSGPRPPAHYNCRSITRPLI